MISVGCAFQEGTMCKGRLDILKLIVIGLRRESSCTASRSPLPFLKACGHPSWNISSLSLILVLLLVGTFLTIRRRGIARVGTGSRAVSPGRIMRRTAVRDGAVEKGCT